MEFIPRLDSTLKILFDSVLLALVIIPVLYRFIVTPLVLELNKYQEVESQARTGHEQAKAENKAKSIFYPP